MLPFFVPEFWGVIRSLHLQQVAGFVLKTGRNGARFCVADFHLESFDFCTCLVSKNRVKCCPFLYLNFGESFESLHLQVSFKKQEAMVPFS